jgi:rSAM/selenodomain-associated transferase 2
VSDAVPVAVVIPARREGGRVSAQVARLRYGGFDGPVVVALADGDDTTVVPDATRVAVVRSPQGRGRQMNAAAASSLAAQAEVLLFLHADTVVDADVVARLADLLREGNAVAGAFTLRLDAVGFGYRLVETMVAIRSRLFSLPYGDQAIFVRREVFERVGGYPDDPLMEEVGLIDRLKRVGRILPLDATATASARRYERLGIVRTTLTNWGCLAGYRLGVSPARLARRYYGSEA